MEKEKKYPMWIGMNTKEYKTMVLLHAFKNNINTYKKTNVLIKLTEHIIITDYNNNQESIDEWIII